MEKDTEFNAPVLPFQTLWALTKLNRSVGLTIMTRMFTQTFTRPLTWLIGTQMSIKSLGFSAVLLAKLAVLSATGLERSMAMP
jgi:hypothetical protein